MTPPKTKSVVDQVSGWLKLYDDGSVDRTWTGPPEAKFMSDPVPPHRHVIDGISTVDFSTPDGLKLRAYLPEEKATLPLPILLHFHGGGFCISQPDWLMYYAVYTRIARAAPAVVVSVHLRRAPEHRLPAACDDGYAALLWLRSVAQGAAPPPPWPRGAADFRRVFLIGDSSGANVAHHVAARAGACGDETRLGGVILIHPGFCRAERSRSEAEMPETAFLTVEMLDKFLGLALPEGATKDHPMTWPAAGLGEVGRLPRYLYCVAEMDLVRETQMEFYEEMRKGEREVELVVSQGVGHSFYLNKLAVDNDPLTRDQARNLFQRIAEFINATTTTAKD